MARPNKNGTNGGATPVADDTKPGWQGDRDFTEHDDDAGLLAEAQSLAVETLTGDLRDFILDRLKHEQSKMAWHQRSESDQRDVVHQVEAACLTLVTKAVELIAGQGLRTIRATLEQVTIKDSIVGKVVMSKSDEQRHAFVDATGATILIAVADPAQFVGERAPAEITPDQSVLPVGDLLEEVGAVHSAAEDNHADAPFH